MQQQVSHNGKNSQKVIQSFTIHMDDFPKKLTASSVCYMIRQPKRGPRHLGNAKDQSSET
jgi:hypothetical protein